MPEEGLSSVQRAIAILLAVGSEPATRKDSVGVVEIARMLGKEKTQVSRTCRVLTESGLLERDPDTSGYRLGWQLFTLAANAGQQRLLAVAPGVLRKLVQAVGERAHLTVFDGDAALTVLSESPPRALQAAGWIGRSTPLHRTSSGRALLFDHTDDQVRELLAGVRFAGDSPNAPTGVDDLLARLHDAQARGFTVSDQEFEAELVAAAAPVRDFRGRVVAAVNISGPRFRLGPHLMVAGRQVKAAADGISKSLGQQQNTA